MLKARDLRVGDRVRHTKGSGTVFEVKKAGLVTVLISSVENPDVVLTATPYFLERVEE